MSVYLKNVLTGTFKYDVIKRNYENSHFISITLFIDNDILKHKHLFNEDIIALYDSIEEYLYNFFDCQYNKSEEYEILMNEVRLLLPRLKKFILSMLLDKDCKCEDLHIHTDNVMSYIYISYTK